jgi:hypothetical protein
MTLESEQEWQRLYTEALLDRVQPLGRIHRNRQRPPSNGSIERAKSTAPDFTLLRKRASVTALTLIS